MGGWGGCQVFEVSFVQSGRRLSRLETQPLPLHLATPHISAANREADRRQAAEISEAAA